METMIPTFQFLFVILIYIIEEICCSGPDFSDVRYLANNGYELPSQALYKKIYGGHGKRYGVHFPGLLSFVINGGSRIYQTGRGGQPPRWGWQPIILMKTA